MIVVVAVGKTKLGTVMRQNKRLLCGFVERRFTRPVFWATWVTVLLASRVSGQVSNRVHLDVGIFGPRPTKVSYIAVKRTVKASSKVLSFTKHPTVCFQSFINILLNKKQFITT